jgi:hypothetical protein
MPIVHCKLRLASFIPPGLHLVGAMPQHLFRIERFHLPDAPDLFIVRGGELIPCNGLVHENRSHDRTLCVGGFFAFAIRNQANAPRPLELTVSGIGIDAPAESSLDVMLGTFAMETECLTSTEDD